MHVLVWHKGYPRAVTFMYRGVVDTIVAGFGSLRWCPRIARFRLPG